MPEGDTIHKIATFLSAALMGEELTAVMVFGRALVHPLPARVLGVSSKGKHLFIDLAPETRIRVHLGMYGSWHRYPVGQPWAKPRARANLILHHRDWIYVCFSAKEVEVLGREGFRARDRDAWLGPDLTHTPPSIELLRARALDLLTPDTPVTDMLLDQRIASGIGNVYTSEVLFLERCAPQTRVADLPEETFARLYRTAARLLAMNLGVGRARSARPPPQIDLLVSILSGLTSTSHLTRSTRTDRQRSGHRRGHELQGCRLSQDRANLIERGRTGVGRHVEPPETGQAHEVGVVTRIQPEVEPEAHHL
jgi:endonuclease-8